MSEKRTKKQIDANKIDLEIFNLARMLERFARDYNETKIDGLALKVMGMRSGVRSHMHKNDREQTK